MTSTTIQQTLVDLGLNDKEITIYLMLLQVGTSPASTLGDRTNIVRSTAQYTCQQLEKRGLIRMIQKGNTYLYSAEPPEKLLMLLDKQKQELAKKEAKVGQIIGELKGLMNPQSVLPKVQFYEGKEGMIELYEKILDINSPIDSFEDKGEMAQFIPEYIPTFIKRRKKQAIFNRVICPADNPVNISTPKEFRETRFIARDKYPLSCDIKICRDQVSIFSFEKNTAVGIAIRHEDIANNFRLLFQSMWDLLATQQSA